MARRIKPSHLKVHNWNERLPDPIPRGLQQINFSPETQWVEIKNQIIIYDRARGELFFGWDAVGLYHRFETAPIEELTIAAYRDAKAAAVERDGVIRL